MSQVKKLQQGGSLTIDGIRYDATPELINQLSQYLSSYGNTSAPIAGLISDLQAGANVNYNSVGNRISGLTQERSGVDQETFNKRASTEKRSRLATILDNDQVQFDKAANLLKGFRYFDPKSAAQNNTSKQTDIFGNRLFYKYGEAGENGKRKLVADSPENSLISSRLNTFADWLAADENGRKNYKLDSWYNPTNLAAINALYGQYGNNSDAWKARLQQIATNAANDSLTNEDLALLKAFNVVEDNEDGTGTSSTGLTAKDRTAWKNAGYTDDIINALAGKATLDKNGVLRMNEGEDWGLGNWASSNIWFNSDFYDEFTDPRYKPFKDYTLYNGGLYGLNHKDLPDIVKKRNEYVEQGNFEEGEKLIKTLFTQGAREKAGAMNPDYYSTFLNVPGYRYSIINGLVNDVNDMNNGDQIVQYYNLNEPENIGPYRIFTNKYALLDRYANRRRDLTKEEIIPVRGGIRTYDDLSAYKSTPRTAGEQYKDKYYIDLTDSGGAQTGIRVFYPKANSKDKRIMIQLPGEGWDQGLFGGWEQSTMVFPEEISNILIPLFKDKRFIDKFVGDASFRKNVSNTLSNLIRRKSNRLIDPEKRWVNDSENEYFTATDKDELFNGFNDLINNKVINPENALALARLLYKYAEADSFDNRIRKYTVPNIEIEKEGGIIKNQFGGVAGGGTGSTGVTEQRADTKNKDPRNAAVIGDKKAWTKADDLDLAALLGDVASLGFAFVPGANIGSAVAGFGSSITRHIADTKRGDANVLDLGLNLLMDAATLLPVIGGGAKTIKTANAFRKFLPTIIKAASVYGLGDAVVTSAKKIASGEGWTVRDVSKVVNGLTAGIGVKRSGGLKSSKTKGVELLSKDKKSKIFVPNEKFKGLSKDTDVSEIFFEAAKKNNPNLTLEQFLDQFDVNQLRQTTSKWLPELKKPKTWFKKTDAGKEFNYKKQQTKGYIDQTGNPWKDWMHGVSDENKLWRNTVLGETEPITITRSLKRTYTPKTIKFKGKDIQFTPEEIAQIVSRKDINKLLMSKLPKNSSKQDLIELYMEFNKQKNQTKLVRNSSGKVPDGYKRVGPIRKSKQKGLGIKVGDVYNISADYRPWTGLALPQLVASAQTEIKGEDRSGFMPYRYKKGGVVKAQNSTPGGLRSGLDLSGLDLTFTNKKKDNSLFGFNTTIGTGTNFGSYIIADKDGKVRRIDNNPIGSLDFTPEPYSGLVQNSTSVIQNDTDTEQGNTVSEFQKEKDWTSAINTLNYLKTKNDVKKTVDNITSVPAYTMQGYNPSSPRFVLSGLGNQYRDAANKMKFTKQVTSDQNIANADIRQRMAQVNDYYLKGAMQDSKEWSAYQTGLSDFANKVYGKNWDIAAQNRYSWNSKLMRDAQARNAGISEISKHRNNWVYSMLDQYNRERLNRDRTNAIKYDFDVFGPERSKLSAKAAEINAKYGGDTENPGYKFEMENLRRQAENLQLQTMNNMSLFKSGGKVSKSSGGKNSKVTYSRDPYPDLLLQESKNSDKKVEKINDAIIKLILQTKPIHVS